MLVNNRDGNDPSVSICVVPLANATLVLDIHAFVATFCNDEADTLRFFTAGNAQNEHKGYTND